MWEGSNHPVRQESRDSGASSLFNTLLLRELLTPETSITCEFVVITVQKLLIRYTFSPFLGLQFDISSYDCQKQK